MTVLLTSLAAIGFYLAAARVQLARARSGKPAAGRRAAAGLTLAALALHALAIALTTQLAGGFDLGFFRVSSLIAWFICGIAFIGALRRPLDNLAIALGPLAGLAIASDLLFSAPVVQEAAGGILTHVLSSILAYSVLTLAALQAALLALQEHRLKQRRTRGLLNALPPLQTMEALLFELLWVGVALLSVSIISGWLFLEDIFAQHLVHKTTLSITAWIIFTTLLWGRHARGWRAQTAVRWTLGGFLALMLGYFGSKLVLELILQRP